MAGVHENIKGIYSFKERLGTAAQVNPDADSTPAGDVHPPATVVAYWM